MNFSSLLFQVFDSDVMPQPEVPPTDLAVINTTAYLIIPSIVNFCRLTQKRPIDITCCLQHNQIETEFSGSWDAKFPEIFKRDIHKLFDKSKSETWNAGSAHFAHFIRHYPQVIEFSGNLVFVYIVSMVLVALMCLPAHMIENGEWCVSNETSSLEDFGIRTSNTLATRSKSTGADFSINTNTLSH